MFTAANNQTIFTLKVHSSGNTRYLHMALVHTQLQLAMSTHVTNMRFQPSQAHLKSFIKQVKEKFIEYRYTAATNIVC